MGKVLMSGYAMKGNSEQAERRESQVQSDSEEIKRGTLDIKFVV